MMVGCGALFICPPRFPSSASAYPCELASLTPSQSPLEGEREGMLRERDGDDAVSFLPIQSSRKRFTEPTHDACNDKRATRTL